MGQVWRNTRYEYRKRFKKHKGLEDLAGAKRNCPKGIEQSDWEYLCDMFADPTHLAKCAIFFEIRKKRKWNSKNESVSNARHHVHAGKDLDGPTGQIETFRDQHYSDETGWVGEDLVEKYLTRRPTTTV